MCSLCFSPIKKSFKKVSLTIRSLQAQDVAPIAAAFHALGWNKPVAQYQRYLHEQDLDLRTVLVALNDAAFVCYVTILWTAEYFPFRAAGIPEIRDFNVLPASRRMGVGACLMDEAERLIALRSPKVGLGVGLTADYGAAQRLYAARGYVPDGRGLVWNNEFVEHGQQVSADDDLTLQLVKSLQNHLVETAKSVLPAC